MKVYAKSRIHNVHAGSAANESIIDQEYMKYEVQRHCYTSYQSKAHDVK